MNYAKILMIVVSKSHSPEVPDISVLFFFMFHLLRALLHVFAGVAKKTEVIVLKEEEIVLILIFNVKQYKETLIL